MLFTIFCADADLFWISKHMQIRGVRTNPLVTLCRIQSANRRPIVSGYHNISGSSGSFEVLKFFFFVMTTIPIDSTRIGSWRHRVSGNGFSRLTPTTTIIIIITIIIYLGPRDNVSFENTSRSRTVKNASRAQSVFRKLPRPKRLSSDIIVTLC